MILDSNRFKLSAVLLSCIFMFASTCKAQQTCIYKTEADSFSFYFKDSLFVENLSRSLYLCKKNLNTKDSVYLLKLESKDYIYTTNIQGFNYCKAFPKISEIEEKNYCIFIYEIIPSKYDTLYTKIVIEALSLDGTTQIKNTYEGYHTFARTLDFHDVGKSIFLYHSYNSSTSDKAINNKLKSFFKDFNFFYPNEKIDRTSPQNFVQIWNIDNDDKSITENKKIIFTYFNSPFYPENYKTNNIRKTIKNEQYNVFCDYFGNVLAYDKKRRKHFAVWSKRTLQINNFGDSLSWYNSENDIIYIKDNYEGIGITINLNSGDLQFIED